MNQKIIMQSKRNQAKNNIYFGTLRKIPYATQTHLEWQKVDEWWSVDEDGKER